MQSSKLANGQRAVIHSLATLMLAIGAAGTQLYVSVRVSRDREGHDFGAPDPNRQPCYGSLTQSVRVFPRVPQ